ncbi:hypothetical protein AYJ58_16610 [Shewanella sp. Pdp11]|nr:hypothetical protein AYJ58_16610 [Shewanella sp. Pdp11]
MRPKNHDDYQQDALIEFNRDITWRMFTGALIYVACWSCIVIPYNVLLGNIIPWELMWVCFAFLASSGVIRLSFVYDFYVKSKKDPHTNRLGLYVGLLANSATWSGVTAFIVYHPEFESMGHFIMVIFGILYAFISLSLCIDKVQLRIYLISYILPISIAYFAKQGSDNVYIACLLWASTVPVYRIAMMHHREYWSLFHQAYLLKNYSAKLAELARTDDLTGLMNQRSFNQIFEQEIQQAVESRQSYGLLLVDIDHFKMINDSYGHLTGDHCLSQIGLILNRLIEDNIKVARYGGEEFVILLPNATEEKALALAETIRQNLSASVFRFTEREFTITVSVGVAVIYPQQRTDAQRLFQFADEAMYAAKAAGRNRVVLYHKC